MEGAPHYQPAMSTAQTQGVVDSYVHNLPGVGGEFSCSQPGVPQQPGESSSDAILYHVYKLCVRDWPGFPPFVI